MFKQLVDWDKTMLKPTASAVIDMMTVRLGDDTVPGADLPLKYHWFFSSRLFKDYLLQKLSHRITLIKFENMKGATTASLQPLLQMAKDVGQQDLIDEVDFL